MNKKIEKEYKILVTKQQFEALLQMYDDCEVSEQLNIYFDTEDQTIKKLKGGMRIRYKNNKYIFTLKFKHPEGHIELEKEIPHDCINELHHDQTIAAWFKEYGINAPFIEIGRVHTLRYLHRSEVAELCFDISHYNDITDYEIEYEFLQEHDGISKFNEILSHVNLTYEKNCITKLGRMLNSL